MKLSDAIVLGYSEINPSKCMWLTPPSDIPGFHKEKCTGCALGAALFVMGERSWIKYPKQIVAGYWPWTASRITFLIEITWQFSKVMNGESTIEELIAWVRSIEPQEDMEPQGNTVSPMVREEVKV